MKVLTANEIRKVEEKCFELYSNESELMLKAGEACYNSIVKKYGENLVNNNIAVFCGNGKNAGDGFVIAKLLYSYGANAYIVLCDKAPTIAEPLMYFNQAISSGVKVLEYNDTLINADYIVDCIFGIGFSGEPRKPFNSIFSDIANSKATIISIDTPSGCNSTTGEACENAIVADYTIAISTLKYCHILPPANANCGDIDVVDIGIPKDCYNGEYVSAIEKEYVKKSFPKLNFNANKGSNGHLLCLCGSYKMPGAAVISAKAALRSGVGLIKITTPQSAYPIIASHLVEPIFNPVDDFDGTYSDCSIDVVLKDLSWADSIVIGCGIGVNDNTKLLVKSVLENANCPIILDADGINCVLSCIDILKDVKVPIVLTPHPGEMARLTSKTVSEVQSNRIAIAKEFAKQHNVYIVLKGANTVVTDGESVFVNLTGNSGMAIGGCGDMLSGMIGAYSAQGIDLFNSSIAGVYNHGIAGDITAKQKSFRGLTVDDMIEQLGALMSEYE